VSGSRRNAGALTPFVDGCGAWLAQQGYSSAAATRSLTTLGHLGRWMDDRGVGVDQLAEEHVAEFAARYRVVHGHLPASSAQPVLAFLRASGVAASSSPTPLSPVEAVLSEYRRWLVESRGLAEATVRGRQQFARQFLLGRVSAGDPRGVLGITGTELNRFLAQECGRVSDASAVAYAGRLRSLLRFLAARGLAEPGLEQAVPRIARWREATVPQFPSRPNVDRLTMPIRQAASAARSPPGQATATLSADIVRATA
jgi:integrase/recombinase XerD